jgi:hypothetical protein
MKRRFIARSLVVAAASGLLALSTAGPAAAENVGKPLVVDGVWKAYGVYEDLENQLCVRAYHSTAGSSARVWITFNGLQAGPVYDQGGNDNRTCLAAGILDGYGPGTLWIQHINTSGVVTGTTTAAIASL